MNKHREAWLFAITLVIALAGAASVGHPGVDGETAIARAAASLPAARS